MIRATNRGTPPDPGSFEVLSQTTLRLAFKLGRCKADKKLAQEYDRAARSVAIQFMFLATEDEARRKKFEVGENIKASEQLFVLIGYKECLSTNEVRDYLKAHNRASTAEAVSQWYSAIKYVEAAPDRKKLRFT